MKRFLLWFLAFVITMASAVYQRVTGPTYPFRGRAAIGGQEISAQLPRTHETGKDCPINITAADPLTKAELRFKLHNTAQDWTRQEFSREVNSLVGSLPSQPPAGKLDYQIIFTREEERSVIPEEGAIVIRFKGNVPAWLLIPHILVMFLAMLLSTRAGLEALGGKGKTQKLALWTAVLLFFGGFILGPLVQKFAFGAFWTGFPVGKDLTDTKTLVAFLVWLAAVIAGRSGKPVRGWILAAAVIVLVVFLIPHSLLGSELDYTQTEVTMFPTEPIGIQAPLRA